MANQAAPRPRCCTACTARSFALTSLRESASTTQPGRPRGPFLPARCLRTDERRAAAGHGGWPAGAQLLRESLQSIAAGGDYNFCQLPRAWTRVRSRPDLRTCGAPRVQAAMGMGGGSAGRLVAHNVTARAVYKGNRGTAGNSISPYSFSPTSLALVARLSVSLDCRCPRRLCSPLACEHTCKATDISSD